MSNLAAGFTRRSQWLGGGRGGRGDDVLWNYAMFLICIFILPNLFGGLGDLCPVSLLRGRASTRCARLMA